MVQAKQYYHVSVSQSFRLLAPVLISNSILIAIYVGLFGFYVPYSILYLAFLFRILTDVLPVILVHSQYLRKNGRAVFSVDPNMEIIEYISPAQSIKRTFSEIESLQYYGSYGRGSGWYSFESYRYCRILFKDKNELVITCLMVRRVEKTLEEILHLKAEQQLRILVLIKAPNR